MSKCGSFLCIVVILSLLVAPATHAGGYDTKVVFVPNTSAADLRSIVEDSYKRRYKKDADSFLPSALAKIDTCVFDLNTLTRDGWEVKTSRRAWKDFNGNGEPNSYEWGTEYTLQKKIEEKKKGWW